MMSVRYLLLNFCLILLSACQLWPFDSSAAPSKPEVRLQGELSQTNGALQFKTCRTQQIYRLEDSASLGLRRDIDQLMENGKPLFADLRGTEKTTGPQKTLQVKQILRLQSEGLGCADQDFKRSLVVASGHEPEWQARVSSRGLLIERMGETPFIAPYMVESVPGGGTSYATEANGQKVELWIAPTRCLDSMSGTVMGHSAELRFNRDILRGCAYPGGLAR